MKKKSIAKLLGISVAAMLVLCACGETAAKSDNETVAAQQDYQAEQQDDQATQQDDQATQQDDRATQQDDKSGFGGGERQNGGGGPMQGGGGMSIDKSSDEELQTMIQQTAPKFSQDEYVDEETGLSVPYNIYLPDGYEQSSAKYPMMVFIGDATTAGDDMDYPLTQGWGGLIWATEEEQAKNECIVLVPVYPEVILDDHDGYTLTDYVGLTPRMIASVAEKYHADTDRIYGTGQSMGAMTTLFTAANNPDLYAAVLIVDGQWDIGELAGIESQKMIYITAGGDDRAAAGQAEVEAMLDEDAVAYSIITGLDAQSDRDELNSAVQGILDEGNSLNFIQWEAGTVLVGSSINSEHMASFDYGYKLSSVRDWILNQAKK